jgi:hypothetical protein
MEQVNSLLHISRTQAAGDDQLADAVDDSGPGLHAFPVKLFAGAAAFFRGRRIEQDARDYARAEAVGLEEEIAVFGDMDFVHTFALVGIVFLYQSDRDWIPSDTLSGRHVENFCRPAAENRGAV